MNTTRRILTFIVIVASIAAGLCCGVRPTRAGFGDAAWCFVRTGDDAYQDCQYDTFQACLAAGAGNRGFCNVNPTGPPQSGQRKPRS